MFDKLKIAQRLWLMAMTGFLLFLIAVFIGWQGLKAGRAGFEQLSTASQVHLLSLSRIAANVRDNYGEMLLAFQHAPDSFTAAIHDHPTSMPWSRLPAAAPVLRTPGKSSRAPNWIRKKSR
jgi:methyl-accepting chemotaxis protein